MSAASGVKPKVDQFDDPYGHLLDKREMARYLRKSTRSVENLMARRMIPFIKIGADLREFFRARQGRCSACRINEAVNVRLGRCFLDGKAGTIRINGDQETGAIGGSSRTIPIILPAIETKPEQGSASGGATRFRLPEKWRIRRSLSPGSVERGCVHLKALTRVRRGDRPNDPVF